jgi:hypothetical protein
LKLRRKVYFSAIHALLQLQKKYPGAGWFRLQGYLSRDFSIDLGQTTIKKIMKRGSPSASGAAQAAKADRRKGRTRSSAREPSSI